MMRSGLATATCLIVCGCGPSAAQRWAELPHEEKQRRLADNLERGKIHVAPLDGDLKAVETLPQGKSYRVFGEIRFKDPKASRLGGILLRVFRLKADGSRAERNQAAETEFEETPPGVYKFVVCFDPIAEPGKYTIRIKPPGKDTVHVQQFESLITADEFTVE